MKQDYLQQCPMILREFLGYTETIKGRSSSAVDEYFIDLRTFFRFMKRVRRLVPPNADFQSIAIDDIDLEFLRTVTLTDIYEFMNLLRQ